MARYLVLALAALVTAPSHAQEAMQMPAQACPAALAPPPAELAGWKGRVPITAAPGVGALAAATIAPGKGADVDLLPTPEVTYPVRPEHPGGSVSRGGVLGFTVTQQGTYRVAIGSGAWVDLVRDGQAVTSTAHSPGPACTGVRKMVDFPLTPGKYVLEIAGNGTQQLPVLVTRLP